MRNGYITWFNKIEDYNLALLNKNYCEIFYNSLSMIETFLKTINKKKIDNTNNISKNGKFVAYV